MKICKIIFHKRCVSWALTGFIEKLPIWSSNRQWLLITISFRTYQIIASIYLIHDLDCKGLEQKIPIAFFYCFLKDNKELETCFICLISQICKIPLNCHSGWNSKDDPIGITLILHPIFCLCDENSLCTSTCVIS